MNHKNKSKKIFYSYYIGIERYILLTLYRGNILYDEYSDDTLLMQFIKMVAIHEGFLMQLKRCHPHSLR